MLTSPQGASRRSTCRPSRPALRDRYGRTTYGQSCLLARRLVEAGVKFVNVYFARHDRRPEPTAAAGTRTASTTSRCIRSSKKYLLPITDQTLPTLLERPGRPRPARRRRWSSGWASSAARRGSTTTPAATTGRSATRCCWPAAASSAATSTAPPTARRLPRQRPGPPRRPGRDDVPPAGHRPAHGGPRHAGSAAADRRGQPVMGLLS